MSTAKLSAQKRISKSQWLTRALDILAREGIHGIRVDRLARDFGISRAGFYYHFRGREDLLAKLLEFWASEFTGVVTQNKELPQLQPEQRLLRIMQLIHDKKLARYDLAIRDWANWDRSAERVVKKVYKTRTDYVRSLFREIGFRGQQLEMRTRLFVCYHSWEQTMYATDSKTEQRKLLKLRHNLLISK